MRDYHKYLVWERAYNHALAIRKLARRMRGPVNSALRSQMVRSADSVVFNIVEGCGAQQRVFARFLQISIDSANELQAQLELAHGDGVLGPLEWKRLNEETIEIRKMIWGLRERILEDLRES
jgi:four helix bundle protein